MTYKEKTKRNLGIYKLMCDPKHGIFRKEKYNMEKHILIYCD
jgi:hypothetical protein